MLLYLIFRFWFALGLRFYAYVYAWMPTNYLARWVNTDRGIRVGPPHRRRSHAPLVPEAVSTWTLAARAGGRCHRRGTAALF